MSKGLALALFATVLARADFHVSANGSDSNSGVESQPFATLERARDAARKAGQRSNTIWVHAGSYYLTGTLALRKEDSFLSVRAVPGEEVRITGGREVTNFQLSSRANVLQADLRAQGITNFGALRTRGMGRTVVPAALELFFNDRPMPLARWPNRGWAYIAAVPAGKDGGRFTYDGERPKAWANAPDLWIHGYWTYDWADSYERVSSIDPVKHEIATAAPHGVYGYTAGRRWQAINLLEELDEPGEWYLDRSSGILYFWPPAPIDGARVVVSLLEAPLIAIDGAAGITIAGLVLEATRADAVRITGGEDNLVSGCVIRNVGNRGVAVNGGSRNGVAHCDIYETGDGGILLSGGDRPTLTPANLYATNNHIHHFSRWDRTYRPAIQFSGVGNHAEYNLIHHGSHNAIQLSGNDHAIELNDIHTVEMESGDVGAFYMGRDWTMRGNVIRHNFFHNLQVGDVNAVYLDDCASGTFVYGNVFHRAGRAAFIGGGRDNIVENNVFIDCNPSVHVDARGLTWASFWFDGRDPALMNGLKAMPYRDPLWSARYPELPNILDDEPAVPKRNVVARNVSSGGKWTDLADGTAKWVTLRDNTVADDPGFVDRASNDFRLRDDSPAFAAGFKRIPMESIGLYAHNARPEMPEVDVVHSRVEVVEQASGGKPARLRLVVENIGRTAASGAIYLWVFPEERATLRTEPRLGFTVAPGGSKTLEFQVDVKGDAWVGAQRTAEDLNPIGVRLMGR